MKKIILIALLVFNIHNSNALSVTDLSVSPISGTNDININLKTYHGSTHTYFSNSYTIVNNVITLRVCYIRNLATVISYTNQNIIIPGINTGSTNYTLVVNLYYANITNTSPPYNFECTSNTIITTATLNFGTVLSNTINLSNDYFENKDNVIQLFPNPNRGKFSLINLQNFNIEIYDILGQLVFLKKESSNEVDTGLKKGIYLVKIYNANGKTTTQKMVVE